MSITRWKRSRIFQDTAMSRGPEMAMDQLGMGCGHSAPDSGGVRLHDLRLEGRQPRQDLRLAPPAGAVIILLLWFYTGRTCAFTLRRS